MGQDALYIIQGDTLVQLSYLSPSYYKPIETQGKIPGIQ